MWFERKWIDCTKPDGKKHVLELLDEQAESKAAVALAITFGLTMIAAILSFAMFLIGFLGTAPVEFHANGVDACMLVTVGLFAAGGTQRLIMYFMGWK